MLKRTFDLLFAFLGLLLLFPFLIVVAALIKSDSKGTVFFRQERMGKGGRSFLIYKFRTMVQDAPQRGGPVTIGGDPRITRVGYFLRQSKLDELPQLFNVLKGEMSFVGPRPELRQYVEMFWSEYDEILKVRPGITDLASITFRDEAALLGSFEDPGASVAAGGPADSLRGTDGTLGPAWIEPFGVPGGGDEWRVMSSPDDGARLFSSAMTSNPDGRSARGRGGGRSRTRRSSSAVGTAARARAARSWLASAISERKSGIGSSSAAGRPKSMRAIDDGPG